MKRGRLQLVGVTFVGVIGGAFLLGQALDSVQNALALVSPFVTYVGSAALLGGGALVDALLRWFPQRWIHGGTQVRIRGLGPLAWAPVLGAVALLWVPRLNEARAPLATPSPAVLAPLTPVTSFFPYYVGTTWTYAFGALTQDGPGPGLHVRRDLGSYSDTVIMVKATAAPSVRIVGIRRTGTVPYLLRCTDTGAHPGLLIQGDATVWMVTDEHQVFEACTRDAADEIAGYLSGFGAAPKALRPEYVLPFAADSAWGGDPDRGQRLDTLYQWYVQGKEAIGTAAGQFDDCYRITFGMLALHKRRWLCKGVGLVAWEYVHHGMVEEYRAELTKWSSPATR